VRIYLAAQYARRLELCGYRDDLKRRGHVVTSRWLAGDHQIGADGRILGEQGETWFEGTSASAAATRELFARHDLEDITAAEMVIAFTEDPGLAPAAGSARGGRHVELGYALGIRARGHRPLTIAVVGPRENLFCWLPELRHWEDWPAFLNEMDAEQAGVLP